MSETVVVNGKSYSGKSIVRLFNENGNPVLFKAISEMTGGFSEIAAMAYGEFSVSDVSGEYTIQHEMPVAPDVAFVVPKYWHDTQDNNFAILVTARHASATGGRRTVSGDGQTHFQGGISAKEKDWSSEIPIATSSLAKFRPTYMDAEGNTGHQVYRWFAVAFLEGV